MTKDRFVRENTHMSVACYTAWESSQERGAEGMVKVIAISVQVEAGEKCGGSKGM